jgi:hypothetical protein
VSTRLTLAFVLLLLGAGCGREESPRAFVIPGPTGPSPVPTAAPFVWDTRDELAVWAANNVTSGAIVIEGDGTDAFIRVERTDQDWVLRGPDFSPMATGVVGVRVRCRFMPDPSLRHANDGDAVLERSDIGVGEPEARDRVLGRPVRVAPVPAADRRPLCLSARNQLESRHARHRSHRAGAMREREREREEEAEGDGGNGR